MNHNFKYTSMNSKHISTIINMIPINSKGFYFFIAFVGLILFSSCEETFIPDTIDAEQAYIVEGYVISSERNIPPYVILTKSIPFFSEIGQETLNSIFVKNAIVTIDDGAQTTTLTQVCLQDLPEDIKPMVTSGLGLDSINPNFDFCFYIDLLRQVDVHELGSYQLHISVDGKEISAQTSIPSYIGLDSLWMQETPGDPIDTLRQLYCRIDDPAGIPNFYQYKNGYKNEPITSPFVSSIADFLFDGKAFKFPMDRAVKDFKKEDSDTFAYFRTGDSIQVEWSCIDNVQYEFWNTLELDRIQQGPFSSYVKAKTNIIGGLGVFMGKSSQLYFVKN